MNGVSLEIASLSVLFKSIGDPVRLRLLMLLAAEELTVGELVRILDMPQSSVSRHLKVLREQGLVADRPLGAASYYRASLEADLGNGDTALRDALAQALGPQALPAADRKKLQQVLALRQIEEGELFFDRMGARWDTFREECFGPAFHLEAFVHLLPAHWTVADLGTGTGYLLPPLARHFRRVVGVDMSEPMLEVARRHAQAEGLENIELLHGRLEDLPLAEGQVDLAVALLMLHHLAQPGQALQEIWRVLKPGGRVLIVEIGPHANERFRAAMADRRMGIDSEGLVQELERAGFSEVRAWPFAHDLRPEHELAPLPPLYSVLGKRPEVC